MPRRRLDANTGALSLNQLRAFVAVAERASFTQAAVELDISQPGVSLLIRKLETHLNVALLQRGKVVTLTTAGTCLLPFAKQAVRAAHRGAQAVRALDATSLTKPGPARQPS